MGYPKPDRYIDQKNHLWQGVPSIIREEKRKPDSTFVIESTPEQDEKMQGFVKEQQRNPTSYSFGMDDCRTFVDKTLEAGGVETETYWNKGPKKYYEATKKKYGK